MRAGSPDHGEIHGPAVEFIGMGGFMDLHPDEGTRPKQAPRIARRHVGAAEQDACEPRRQRCVDPPHRKERRRLPKRSLQLAHALDHLARRDGPWPNHHGRCFAGERHGIAGRAAERPVQVDE
jgi:hypothetical protein